MTRAAVDRIHVVHARMPARLMSPVWMPAGMDARRYGRPRYGCPWRIPLPVAVSSSGVCRSRHTAGPAVCQSIQVCQVVTQVHATTGPREIPLLNHHNRCASFTISRTVPAERGLHPHAAECQGTCIPSNKQDVDASGGSTNSSGMCVVTGNTQIMIGLDVTAGCEAPTHPVVSIHPSSTACTGVLSYMSTFFCIGDTSF